MNKSVSLVTYKVSPGSLRQALEWCNAFENLNASDSIVIKPNLVTWNSTMPIAPYGVFTTTRLVEDLVVLLKEAGCDNIVIGEGSVVMDKTDDTMAAFQGLGYERLVDRYGVKLVDFNQGPTHTVEVHDGFKLHIAEEAEAADFFVNMPVLKTHGQSIVSLGLKNLKGCLKLASKKFCHNTDLRLEYCFSHVVDYIKPDVTIIDGIYALEKGALHFGNAYRKDLVIASRDPLAADMVAAKSIGYEPEEIDHFRHYVERHGSSLDLSDYDITGESLEDHVQPLKWDWSWTEGNTGPKIFDKMGVTGIALPKYDDTLCSGCSPVANMCNILTISAFKGEPLPKVEILNGKKMQARPGYDTTLLLGNCIIKANENNGHINQSIAVKGCPPSTEDVVKAMKDAGLDVNELAYVGYLKQQGEKYNGKEGYSPDFYTA